jgi:DNA polymerase
LNEDIDFLNLAEDYLRGGYRKDHSNDPVAHADSLDGIAADISACNKCRLCQGRKHCVPGEGFASPLLLAIGEGPGADEDASGRPFVGAAGQLLDKELISIAIDRRENCFIANTVKCRPPGNRDPAPDELAACAPFLQRQITLLAPKAILALGRIASHALLNTDTPIGRLRGNWFTYTHPVLGGIPLLPTYHPSALLRDASYKAPAFEDLKKMMVFLAENDAEYRKKVEPLMQKYKIAVQ